MVTKSMAVPALTAAIGFGLAVPTAEACYFLYRKKATTEVRREERPAVVEQRPVAGPPPAAPIQQAQPVAQCSPAAQRPVAGPPPAAPAEGCNIESKAGFDMQANVVRPKTRLVEAVYETREKKRFIPAVLETRFREIQHPAVYQTGYEQEWVAPVYQTVCNKEWVPPTFKTVSQEIKGECQYKDVTFQKYCPAKTKAVTKTRCVPDGKGGFSTVDDVDIVIEQPARFETVTERKMVAEGCNSLTFQTVQDKPGFWKEHIQTVMVQPGYYRTVEKRMLVKEAWTERVAELVEVSPARCETVQEQVLVRPAHYEEVTEELVKNPC
jgi:hypothetical protein